MEKIFENNCDRHAGNVEKGAKRKNFSPRRKNAKGAPREEAGLSWLAEVRDFAAVLGRPGTGAGGVEGWNRGFMPPLVP